jgi:hypothetical protein
VSEGYWVLANQAALPRVFVPKRVQTVADTQIRLLRMSDTNFDPREVAFVDEPVSLVEVSDGTARIEAEVPTRVSVVAEMKTPGLVVLSDLWDTGWKAYLDGRQVPILHADHAVRGVVVPAGTSAIEFRYEPASLRLGVQLASVAAILLLAWAVLAFARRGRGGTSEAVAA